MNNEKRQGNGKEQLLSNVQYLRDTEQLSFRQIAEELGICRKRCSAIYCINSKPAEPITAADDFFAPHRELVKYWFSLHPTLKSIQVYKRLRERGVNVGYRTVSRYTREFRRKKRTAYWPLSFLAGEEAQVDWFFVNHAQLGKLSGFIMILSFSRFLFSELFPRSSFEFFIHGHLMAFDAFGGYPRALRYDNMKSVVLKRNPLTYNPSFSDFARHYGFEIRLCNVAAGNEKGRVERAIRSLRETFFNAADHHQSLSSLNRALLEWVHNKNNTIHRSTGKTPSALKNEEQLKPLPQIPWHNTLILTAKKATKTGFVIFDTNKYSIPDYLVDEVFSLHVFVDRIEIYDSKRKKVATHPRSFARDKNLLNPIHRSIVKLSAEAKRQRIFAVIKALDPALEQFLLKNESVGEDPHLCAYYIFRLLKSHARQTILSLIRQALQQQRYQWKFIISLLQPHCTDQLEPVLPQNSELLQLDYQPRNLEDYQE